MLMRTPRLTASSTQALLIASAVATLIWFCSIMPFVASPRMRNLSLSSARAGPESATPANTVTAAAASSPYFRFMF